MKIKTPIFFGTAVAVIGALYAAPALAQTNAARAAGEASVSGAAGAGSAPGLISFTPLLSPMLAPGGQAPTLSGGISPTAAPALQTPAAPLDLSGFQHVVFDVRGSRGGKGDVAAGYLTAADMIRRSDPSKPLPRITFIAGEREQLILAKLAGGRAGEDLFDGRAQVDSVYGLKEGPRADLYIALAAHNGEFARLDQLRRPGQSLPPRSIPVTDGAVAINQTVLGNTENALKNPPTLYVDGHRLTLTRAGVGQQEAGVYADPVAEQLRGASAEVVRRFTLDHLTGAEGGKQTALRSWLEGRALTGAAPALAYGVSVYSVKPQLRGYLRALVSDAKKGRKSYLLVTPSSVRLQDYANDGFLRKRIVMLNPAQPLPEVAKPGKVYILPTGSLPHPVFVGLMAYAQAPPIVAGDGAMSAAIGLGRPFVMTRVAWNGPNIDRYAKRLALQDPDGAWRRLVGRVYKWRLLFPGAGLREAMKIAARPEPFARLSAEIPILTDSLVAAARGASGLVRKDVALDAMLAGVGDPSLRASIVAERVFMGDPSAWARAFSRLGRVSTVSALAHAAVNALKHNKDSLGEPEKPRPQAGANPAGQGPTDAEFSKAVKTFLRIMGTVVAAAGAWIGAGLLGFVDPKAGIEFLSVYGVELSLSADNLVAFAAILAPVALKISPKAAQSILKTGLWGALALRVAASFFGLKLIAAYGSLAMLGGGAVLVLLAMKILLPEKYSPLHVAGGALGRVLAPGARLIDALKSWIGRGGRAASGRTAAFVVAGALLAVAFTDITFAVDSIPTALGLTKNLGVIVLANIASVLGLSQFYVILQKTADRFHLVNKGVGLALAVVAAKMILEAMHLWHLALLPSVAIVMAPILLALALSPFIQPSGGRASGTEAV